MIKSFKYLSLAIFTTLSFSSCSNLKVEREKPYVVMVSLDAFRWDYDSIHGTPVLDDIARHGVMAERLIPSFPTKTFPNHYTIATGTTGDAVTCTLSSMPRGLPSGKALSRTHSLMSIYTILLRGYLD